MENRFSPLIIFITLSILLLLPLVGSAQRKDLDLKLELLEIHAQERAFDSVQIISRQILKLSSKEENSKAYSEAMYRLSEALGYTGQSDSIKIYIPNTIELLDTLKDSLRLGKLYSFWADSKAIYGLLDSASQLYKTAYNFVPFELNSTWNVFIIERLAYVSFSTGDYYNSLNYYRKCIENLKKLDNENLKFDLSRLHNSIGLIYRNIEDYDLEKENYLEAIEILKGEKPNLSVAMAYNNLAEVYRREKNDSLAIASLAKAKFLYDELEFELGLSAYYSILLSISLEKEPDNYTQAAEYAKLSMDIAEKYNDFRMMSDAAYYYAQSLINQNKHSEAERVLSKSLEISKNNQLFRETNKLLDLFSLLYKDQGKYKESLKYLEESLVLSDSLVIDDNIKALFFLDQRFKDKKLRMQDSIAQIAKDQEIRFAFDQQASNQKNTNIIIGLIISILLIILFFIYSSMRKSKLQAAQLEEKNRIIEKAMKAKSDFFSTMSHELRSPLNSIIGTSSLLMSANNDSSQNENFEALSFSSNNLLMLINDILDFSKIEAGKMTFDNVDINLQSLAKSIIKIHQPSVDSERLKLELHIDEHIPILELDPTRISQVLNNLVSNAIKFSQEGVVELKIQMIEENDSTCKLYFHVKDEGIGIAATNMDKIFDSYSQSDNSISRSFGGTGLGLTISQHIIQLLGSYIHVKSELGVGSTFYFEIELKKATVSSSQLNSEEIDKKKIQLFNLESILLVEDNKLNILVATQFLKKWNLKYQVAENGQEALDLLLKNKFDLILMDCMMPIMDGYEATREIRKTDADIPILALTASAMPDDKKNIMASGMNDYELKPFDPGRLNKKIARYLIKDQES